MNNLLSQQIAVGVIVTVAAIVLVFRPLIRNFVAPSLAHYFLKKGNVAWAMRFKKWSNKGCC